MRALESIKVSGYRSLREFRLKPRRVTVVTGGNGVGKSNLYRALALLQRMAEGRFVEALAAEGGMPSALWPGARRKDEVRRISWEITHSDFDFSIECGMVALGPDSPSLFRTDPEIKANTDHRRHSFTSARRLACGLLRREESRVDIPRGRNPDKGSRRSETCLELRVTSGAGRI